MSRRTGVYDTVGVSREVNRERSAGERGSISKAARALFFKDWERNEGIWIELFTRFVSEHKNQAGLSRAYRSISDSPRCLMSVSVHSGF